MYDKGRGGGYADLDEAFPDVQFSLEEKIVEEKISVDKGEDLVVSKIDERHHQFLSDKKKTFTMRDVYIHEDVDIEIPIEDVEKVQALFDDLSANPLTPILVHQGQITLADLANLGIMLNKEVGLFLNGSELFLVASATNLSVKAPGPEFVFCAHFHPTLSDEKHQISGEKGDMGKAGEQLEVVVNAKYTVLIYSEEKYYNVLNEHRATLSSALNPVKTKAEHHRPYFREPIGSNFLKKLGKEVEIPWVAKVAPMGTKVTPDDEGFLDLFGSGQPDLPADVTASIETPAFLETGPAVVKKKSSTGFFDKFVKGSTSSSSSMAVTKASKMALLLQNVNELLKECSEEEATELLGQIYDIKAEIFSPKELFNTKKT